ncbi:DUF4079 domain-containing protein [Spirulina sp. CS-785/01]|uniref:DUF4079 domain-containing protein n=1 Tax=Spirulina sp. CS-785/01 TaxID=3021716 RepID=UPI00232EDA1F|nr:DUF4079 domain-containing protein [Spirulina sp. CS-785/01]MDB9315326.1 DUF4079 domain-containing protein [Spirulina sp. CS-785/01]
MDAQAWAALIHPAIAVLFVFPLLGIVINFALQTRQRRLAQAAGEKSKIPPMVGREHLQMGRWLTGGVVGVSLLAIAYSLLFKNFIKNQLLQTNPWQGWFIIILFIFTIASLIFLYRARQKLWRVIFVTLTSMGLIILGFQEGVFRRDNEWYMSHFYYGITASILMLISLAIVQEIYQDRSLKWRKAHIILNSLASLLFVGQGLTGVRDLFEIGLYTPPPQ